MTDLKTICGDIMSPNSPGGTNITTKDNGEFQEYLCNLLGFKFDPSNPNSVSEADLANALARLPSIGKEKGKEEAAKIWEKAHRGADDKMNVIQVKNYFLMTFAD